MKEQSMTGTIVVDSGNKEVLASEDAPRTRKCCRGGCTVWCKKYFWEGQNLSQAHAEKLAKADENASVFERAWVHYRRVVALLLPGIFVHFFWWGVMIQRNLWHLFPEKYYMTVTMIFGSIIAGMTSEGGGAVAFPVMTLGFGIAPSVARDFSMMIQSIGMTCASVTILSMKVKLEWQSVPFCSLGGIGGMIFGLHMFDPWLTPPQKKMFFVSIWFAFASVLLLLNRHHKRPTHDKIQNMCLWKGLVLVLTGFVGGVFTSFAGSGLDICSFSILTLLFRVTEKVATPTSVVLMAGNSIVGFYWRGVMMGDISQEAWDFLVVCVPVVVFGAPLGSVLGSHFHRLVLSALVIGIDVVALVGAYAIVPLTPVLIGVSVGIIVGGFVLFALIGLAGHKLLLHSQALAHDKEVTRKQEEASENVKSGSLSGRVTCSDNDIKYASHDGCNGTSTIENVSESADQTKMTSEPICYVSGFPVLPASNGQSSQL